MTGLDNYFAFEEVNLLSHWTSASLAMKQENMTYSYPNHHQQK
jgi:hypothetical protein